MPRGMRKPPVPLRSRRPLVFSRTVDPTTDPTTAAAAAAAAAAELGLSSNTAPTVLENNEPQDENDAHPFEGKWIRSVRRRFPALPREQQNRMIRDKRARLLQRANAAEGEGRNFDILDDESYCEDLDFASETSDEEDDDVDSSLPRKRCSLTCYYIF